MPHAFELAQGDRDPRHAGGGLGGDRHRPRDRRLVPRHRQRGRAAPRRDRPDLVRRGERAVDGHGLGPASALRAQRRGARPERHLPRDGVHDRGPRGRDDRRPTRPLGLPRGRLGVRVRRPERGRLHVPPPARASTSSTSAAGRRRPSRRCAWVSTRRPAWRRSARRWGSGTMSAEGAPVDFAPAGIPAVDGVVDFVSPGFLGVRTSDALYRFMISQGMAYAGHHLYGDGVDAAATRRRGRPGSTRRSPDRGPARAAAVERPVIEASQRRVMMCP